MAEPLLVITGATASGKSEVALEVARALDGEIVSMDSRQVYRGMDIGTAKPSAAERAAIPHHGLDLVNPDQRYSAGQFARDARRWIADIRRRNRVPVVVGGTGFFLRALLQPLFPEPALEPPRRERLRGWLEALDTSTLRRWVAALDPAAAATDRQRLTRLLEVALLTGKPLAWWHLQTPGEPAPFQPSIFVLERPRDLLYQRIDTRVHAMIDAGLVEEVRSLLGHGYHAGAPGMNATGYIELLPYLAGEGTLESAVVAIQNATRSFARRQLTWFRHQLPPQTVHLPFEQPGRAASTIVSGWRMML